MNRGFRLMRKFKPLAEITTMASNERVVRVTTTKEAGGITATVTTDEGNVYTGRSHPSQGFFGNAEVTEEKAIREATKKMNK